MARTGELGGQEHREAARLSCADQLLRIGIACRALEPRGKCEGRIQVPEVPDIEPAPSLSVPVHFGWAFAVAMF
jgi:hypothetical protein